MRCRRWMSTCWQTTRNWCAAGPVPCLQLSGPGPSVCPALLMCFTRPDVHHQRNTVLLVLLSGTTPCPFLQPSR